MKHVVLFALIAAIGTAPVASAHIPNSPPLPGPFPTFFPTDPGCELPADYVMCWVLCFIGFGEDACVDWFFEVANFAIGTAIFAETHALHCTLDHVVGLEPDQCAPT